MTCAKQWQADDEPAPFDDGLCRRGHFFDVEGYKGSVIHYGCTGGPGSNESHSVYRWMNIIKIQACFRWEL